MIFVFRPQLQWILPLACLLLAGLCPSAGAAVFTVTNAADSGAGSLRWAIESSNAAAGPNVINFNAGLGSVTIAPASPLPTITVPVTIDGTTQPGFAGTPIVQLNGANAGATACGLHITAGNSTIRGLVINRFLDSGIWIGQSGGNVVEGNYIGTDITGLLGLGNSREGILIDSAAGNNRIGGTSAAARNVISNNKKTGIWVTGGAGNNLIIGNYVGVDATGLGALGNSTAGVLLETSNNVVGGTTPASRNVMSANGWSGLYLYTVGASGNLIQGNYLGTDATGLLALGNKDRGLAILDGSGNTVGGVSPGARNLISGNLQSGLLIDGLSAGTVVQGNYIGPNVTGMAGLGNGIDGIEIRTAHDNTIGGSAPGAANLVSGNQESGISIFQSAYGNIVQGNLIGTKADGVGPLGNQQYGVFVFYSAAGNIIGGSASGQGNTVAFNCAANIGFDGVRLHYTAALGNRVSGNSILSNNGGLGIDIGVNGVTPNDPGDTDQLQNFPLLTCAATMGARTIVYGTLSSIANQTFTVELFSNPAPNPAGYGSGEKMNASTPVLTDASGKGSFAIVFPTAGLAGAHVSATATSAAISTSEFAADIIASSADSDGDGIPNVLEAAFQLNPNDPTDAAKDADGDGAGNLQEIMAGTNPADPSSRLIISALGQSGPAVTVSFPSVSGLRYRLESSPDLLPPWLTVVGDIVGTGGVVQASDPGGAGSSRRFYRIIAVP